MDFMDISGTRNRYPGEIIPIGATQSATKDNDEESYGAERAIDLDYGTLSGAVPENRKSSWLKISLGQVYCVQQVVRRKDEDEISQIWDCSNKDCSCVAGTKKEDCENLYITVSTEGVSRDLPPISGCSHGNTVTYGRKSTYSYGIGARELLIIGTASGKGKIIHFFTRVI